MITSRSIPDTLKEDKDTVNSPQNTQQLITINAIPLRNAQANLMK